LLNKPILLVSL
jgi:hypothetical protein